MPELEQPILSDFLRALADDTRLRIVALLAGGEQCVCHLQDALGVSQPFVSRHLAVLRRAGIVTDRRKGSWVHYRLAPQPDPLRRALLRRLGRAIPVRRSTRTCS